MLIPRFSLRSLLLLITVSSLFCFVVTLAIRGHEWALAITIAVASLFTVFTFHACVFCVAWLISLVGGLLKTKQSVGSPFAYQQPPPQHITPPEDVE